MAIIGIDLGTTNSLVSIWQEDRCVLIPNNFGEYLTPSVVGVDDTGEILIGKTAKERLISHPKQTVNEFKRFMGTEKSWILAKKRYFASDLSALLLKKLKQDAEVYLQETVDEAVISVPAYFNDDQRNATKMAGELAGLKVERLVNEPSAAALAYRFGKAEEDQTFLVFDFGGGTLDISVVDTFDNVVEIVAVSGDNHLGGCDIDQKIAERFLTKACLDEGELTGEERAILIKRSEQLKRQLSNQTEAEMKMEINGQSYHMLLDSKGLLGIATPILESIGMPLGKALNDSGYHWEDIDEIIMVGGSGKMPIIRNYLQFLSGKVPLYHVDPDTAVAVGVGIYAGIKAREEVVREVLLTDICPFTLGIAVAGSDENSTLLLSPIIERNSVLPISREGRYWTRRPFQEMCSVEILQGEHRLADQNLTLGELAVPVPVSDDPDVREAIDVRYTYDINGILEIDVTVVSTGEVHSKVIVNKNTHLTEEQIKKRREELQKLKIHPRDREGIRLLRARGERMFEEYTGEVRRYINEFLERFTAVVNRQDEKEIEREAKRLTELLDMIETSPRSGILVNIEKYLYEEWREEH